jgi:SAM-dependent methyltransferase
MQKINLINPHNKKKIFLSENILSDDEGNSFPYENEIPIINKSNSYTENFGYQWDKFSKTQLLRESYVDEKDINSLRLFTETNWRKVDLANINILEAGSGAGKFSKVILEETDANLYSFDSSSAVNSNKKNNILFFNKRLFLSQADIENIPYENDIFDKVICLGVLQHTKNFYASLDFLINKIKPGGEIVIDFYPINGFWTKISAKYILRPILKKFSNEFLLKIIEFTTNFFIFLYWLFTNLGLNFMTRFLPICDIKNALPNNLSKNNLREWVILDTFDMFSPEYDNPQKIVDVRKYLEDHNIKVNFSGLVKFKNMKAAVIRGIKK